MATKKPTAAKSIGKNIEYTVEGDILTITVDLSARFGPSASNKTIIVASSEGNQKLADTEGVVVGFNAYVPNPNYVKP